jgi:hypothetical protein
MYGVCLKTALKARSSRANKKLEGFNVRVAAYYDLLFDITAARCWGITLILESPRLPQSIYLSRGKLRV